MRRFIFLVLSVFSIGIILVVGNSQEKISINIGEASKYAERTINETGKVTALAFDGDRSVSFRVMVEDNVTKEEAENVVSEFLELATSHFSENWDYANLSFDFKKWSDGSIAYKGYKMAGSDLVWH
ncbi:hypothetical protein [Chengkuizengella axinellae]|uniref:Uncharacterized protein n=1 Tax=Chengkuizengella axinellae TaxID=3064388 RepID=A0ABT9IX62_9BACL|nr:hypothetical protein [Chengkuizengella sp. 2205SS18-9]MDP5273954.1 hypothetical protein [Chengkuizengella sp. 2205SS18-9]